MYACKLRRRRIEDSTPTHHELYFEMHANHDFAKGFNVEPNDVLVTVCGDRETRRSCDGRYPDSVTEYVAVNVDSSRSGQIAVIKFPVDTSVWAQAEAVLYDPECVEALLVDAQRNTQWRANPRHTRAVTTTESNDRLCSSHTAELQPYVAGLLSEVKLPGRQRPQ